MASIPIVAANITNFVGEIWSLQIKAAAESTLVCVKLFDHRYQADLKMGDTLNVPNLANLSATAVNTEQDWTLYNTVQNTDALIVNYWYESSVGVSDMHRIQAVPTTMEALAEKVGYALGVQKDTNVNALFNEFTQAVGTEASALTLDDVILPAYEYLNAANAPQNDRFWIVDPESVTDLMKIDAFVK